MSKPENPLAFPRPMTRIQRIGGGITTDDGEPGMSLRDWFAGQALIGLLANSTVDMSYEQIAVCCNKHADAMLAERSK